MTLTRVIPCLLLSGNRIVKTKRFKNPIYIGDPVNIVKIFSDKEVDELIVLDIDASRENREPNYELIAEIAGECFMPVAYGGGIRNIEQVRKLIRSGIEKIVINSAALKSTEFIREIANIFGSQAVVGAIDAKKTLFNGYRICGKSGTKEYILKPEEHALNLEKCGVGEIFLNSIDNDGKMNGFDLSLIKLVSSKISIPIVACGGAGSIEHLRKAVSEGGATAVAAGSMFIFYGKQNGILINYPNEVF
jgi:cyclase